MIFLLTLVSLFFENFGTTTMSLVWEVRLD